MAFIESSLDRHAFNLMFLGSTLRQEVRKYKKLSKNGVIALVSLHGV